VKVIESGHYYSAKGPTAWSSVGWSILEKIRGPEDRTLLFVDDVHGLRDVSEREAILPNIDFSLNPDYLVLESEMMVPARGVLGRLQNLPNGSRPRTNGDGVVKWRGFPILSRRPHCVLLDAGLMLHKHRLGFSRALNILPNFYEEGTEAITTNRGKGNSGDFFGGHSVRPHGKFSEVVSRFINRSGEF